MRFTREKPIADIVERLLSQYQLKGKLLELNIVQAWQELMGTSITRQTQQIYFKDDKLFIRLDSSILKNELYFSKTRLIALLNQKLKSNAIQDIILL